MSTGDDDPSGTGSRTGKRTGSRAGRGATRPPTIELEAQEVAPPPAEPGDGKPDETPPVAAESPGSAPASSDAPAEVSAAAHGPGESPLQDDGQSPAQEEPPQAAGSTDDVPGTIEEPAPGEEPAPTERDETPAEPETATTGDAAPAHPPLPTARRASVIAAGLVGALIALAAYLGLYYGGILPRASGVNVTDLNAQLQQVVRRTAALEASAAREARRGTKTFETRIGEFETRIGDFEKALTELGSDPKNTVVRRVAAVEQKAEDLEGRLGAAATSEGLDARISELEDKLPALSGGAPAAAADDARLTALEDRLAALEQRPAPVATGAAAPDSRELAALSQRLATIEASLKSTEEAVAALRATGAADADTAEKLADIDRALASLHADVDKLDTAVASGATALDDRFAAFEKSLGEREAGEARRVARSAAAALAVTALARAVDAGGPYAAELDTLRPLVDDESDLTVLAAHADSGVPGPDALASRFAAVSGDMLAAGGPAPSSGLMNTLAESARSLVRVRRDDAAPGGDGRDAALARIAAALKAGDLPAAKAAWDALEPAAKDASKAWADDLEARIAVDRALAGLSAAAAGSLTGTSGPVQN